jgi:hypothetical protein
MLFLQENNINETEIHQQQGKDIVASAARSWTANSARLNVIILVNRQF